MPATTGAPPDVAGLRRVESRSADETGCCRVCSPRNRPPPRRCRSVAASIAATCRRSPGAACEVRGLSRTGTSATRADAPQLVAPVIAVGRSRGRSPVGSQVAVGGSVPPSGPAVSSPSEARRRGPGGARRSSGRGSGTWPAAAGGESGPALSTCAPSPGRGPSGAGTAACSDLASAQSIGNCVNIVRASVADRSRKVALVSRPATSRRTVARRRRLCTGPCTARMLCALPSGIHTVSLRIRP